MKNIDIIETTLLRGRVKLLQPKVGFHASTDSVLLAAGVPIPPTRHPRLARGSGSASARLIDSQDGLTAFQTPAQGGGDENRDGYKILDVGCGVGSVGLCVLARDKNISLTGIDIQPELIDLAHQNAVLNSGENHARFFHGNILTEKHTEDNAFNAVVMNPPYLEDGTHTPSPEKIKATSRGEGVSGASLADWVKYAHRKLKQGGHLTLIHRADRLDDAIVELEKKRWFGSLVIYPLWSHAGEDAKRIIIQARKERYAPLVLKSGMVIHRGDGQYTQEAENVLSEAAGILL